VSQRKLSVEIVERIGGLMLGKLDHREVIVQELHGWF